MRDCDFGFSVRGEWRSPRHAWEAWRMCLPASQRAQIGLWLLRCPYAHPIWSQWVVSLAHLREAEGLPAAVGTGHSLAISAVDPCIELEPDEPISPASLLAPPIVIDFDVFGSDDIHAVERVELLIERTMRRQLSPDDDYRRLWTRLLRMPVDSAA